MTTCKILVIYATISGNTTTFLPFIDRYNGQEGREIVYYRVGKEPLPPLEDFDKIIIGTYTWSNGRDDGKIPAKLKRLILEHREELLEKDVFVYGTGWTLYSDTFCMAVKSINYILDDQCRTAHYELVFDPNGEYGEQCLKTLSEFMED